MRGMNARTGKSIAGTDHIQQSMTDILLTPIGSRVMRREYGSLVVDLIDQPMNDTTILQLYSAAIMAIQQWERRVVVERITTRGNPSSVGQMTLLVDVVRRDSGINSRDTVRVEIGRSNP
nr:hypothetical protein 22 [Saccharospirillaceae bacterium]